MPVSYNFRFALLFCFSVILLNSYANAIQVSHDGRSITIDGKPRILLSGSIHYPRSTPEVINSMFLTFLIIYRNQIESYTIHMHADVARLD